MTTPGLFGNLQLRGKLRLIVALTSGLAVIGACAAFLAQQWVSSRNAMSRQLEIMAEIVGDQSTAAVEFDQAPQAAAILRSLKAERQIAAAGVYTRDGRLFARYVREGRDPSVLPASPGADGRTFEGGELILYRPLRSGGERIGTFHLRSDLPDLHARLWVNLGTAGLVLIGAVLAVLLLTGGLEKLVTAPVERLEGAVQTISKNRDYSVRVAGPGHDELGRLIEGFNDMLVQIQLRDGALAQAREELERRVQERTRELESEVAERRTAEKLLQEKDARLTEAQEVARLGSWEWSMATATVTWSDEVYRISGLLPAGFGGRFEEFVATAHPDDRKALKDALETARTRREPLTMDYRIIRPDGAVRFLHAKGKVVLNADGQALRLVGTLQDITERKQSDQAIQELNRELQARMADLAAVNKELESFSYSVSHDLRAPLRAIGGFSSMLLQDYGSRVDAEGQRYMAVIQESTRKMGQLIDDLLAFSRLGRKSVDVTTVDLGRLVGEVFKELREMNPDRALELHLDALPPAQGDSAMFRQVLVNLLSNAVKYTRGRDPAVIEVGSRIEGEETVYYFRDNGVGFPMQYAHKLFGVFQRLHSSSQFEGTGVGLALVHRIITRHGGRIWGESSPGKGATFSFALPKTPPSSRMPSPS